jgi:hypothetical protein
MIFSDKCIGKMDIIVVNEYVPEHNLLAFFSKAERVIRYRRPEEAVDFINTYLKNYPEAKIHFLGCEIPHSSIPLEVTYTFNDGHRYSERRQCTMLPFDREESAKISINLIEGNEAKNVHDRIRGFQILGGRAENLSETGFIPDMYQDIFDYLQEVGNCDSDDNIVPNDILTTASSIPFVSSKWCDDTDVKVAFSSIDILYIRDALRFQLQPNSFALIYFLEFDGKYRIHLARSLPETFPRTWGDILGDVGFSGTVDYITAIVDKEQLQKLVPGIV